MRGAPRSILILLFWVARLGLAGGEDATGALEVEGDAHLEAERREEALLSAPDSMRADFDALLEAPQATPSAVVRRLTALGGTPLDPPQAHAPCMLFLRTRTGRSLAPDAGADAGIEPWTVDQTLDFRLAPAAAHARLIKHRGAAAADVVIASLNLRANAWRTEAVIGDFVIGTGQGLLLWDAGAPGKSADVIRAPRRAAFNIRAYRGSSATGYHRGVAVQTHAGECALALWAARTPRPAHADSAGVVTAIGAAIDDPHAVTFTESLLGARAALSDLRWGIGATLAHSSFDRPMRTDATTTAQVDAVAVDGRVFIDPVDLTAEAAATDRGWSAAAGAIVELDSLALLSLHLRHLGGPAAIHAMPFAENQGAVEDGAYAGLRIRPIATLRFSCYLDAWRIPASGAAFGMPAAGWDALAEVRWEIGPSTSVSLTTTHKTRPQPATGITAHDLDSLVIAGAVRDRVRGEAHWESQTLRLGVRVEAVRAVAREGESPAVGTQVMLDARCRVDPRLTLAARVTAFRTASYAARLYQLEAEVAGAYSNPALHGDGRRSYVMATWRPLPALALETKWGVLSTRGTATIGTVSAQATLEM